jgi:hypothetical protein
VNKVLVTIHRKYGHGQSFAQTVPLDKLAAVMTAAEVQEARDAGRIVEVEAGDR